MLREKTLRSKPPSNQWITGDAHA